MSPKAGLHLHTSNRLERLADGLAEVLQNPLTDPFAAEPVVIPTLGLARWLTQQLARRQGICANFSFLFPERFVAGLMDEALPKRAAARFFARENLVWRIMKLLPALVTRPEFAELRRYLDESRPELRRFQLAEKIAVAFDRYLAFRPDIILQWDRGAGSDWQAVLWRTLVESAPGLHPPALAEEYKSLLRRNRAPVPSRISLFGISTLPPFYIQFVQELASAREVHLFLLRPTPEFWGDTVSAREERRARREAPASAQLDLKFARGNPLLSSFGKIGREFLDLVTELNPTEEDERFAESPNDTLLGQIQRDIYHLEDSTSEAPRALRPDDRSLQFHSCHSPMREMEVLHDQLLALFEQHRDLKPHDVVVMAPDISIYAPFIEAVFATAPEDSRIPFSVADRSTRSENGVVDTFMRILELARSRFPASGVIAVLESVALQRRFELTEPDLEIIRGWIDKTGIRWGIDAAHRGALGLPAFGENSWRAGLDRLLLGYAAPARGEKLFAGILAFDEVEGNLAEILGRFVDFVEALFATARDLERPRSLGEWEETLREISRRFFPADDESETDLRHLRHAIDSLGETAQLSGFDEPVPLDVLLAHLEKAFTGMESGSGFLVGCVTFCALRPMRAVPFPVVCLVGMNDTAYPRHDRPPAFDLVAQAPRPGDRNTRDDDRYLFLEAILSARSVLYFSYVGRSIRDNKPLPPSVLVSELLDYSGARPIEHPLQPFSQKYFDSSSGLFSYSEENCLASATAFNERHAPAAFIREKIGEPEADWSRLDNARLFSFFGNPSKFLIRERLGLRRPRLDELLEETEPLEPGGLARYSLEQDFLDRALNGEQLEPLFEVARAGGQLPPGPAGEFHLRELSANVHLFADAVRQHAQGAMAPEQLQLTIGRFELSAVLGNIFNGRLVRQRLTTRKPKDLLGSWIDHLLVNCIRPTESILISATKEKQPVIERFAPPEADSRALLSELLDFYWQGLREALPFFPRSSFAFAERKFHPTNGSSPLEKARVAWGNSAQAHDREHGLGPERDDEYFDLAFRNVEDPLGSEFQRIASAIFEPALSVMTKEKS